MFPNQENLLLSNQQDLDIETIQTDIQRFMAILGFCLMAIFALVQSIPVTSPEAEKTIESLKTRLVEQNFELEKMKAENESLQSRLQKVESKAKAEKSSWEKYEVAKRQVDAQEARIETLAAKVPDESQDALRFRDELSERQEAIEEMKSEMRDVERFVESHEKTPLETSRKAKDESSSASDGKGEGIRGVVVAFASDEAFLDLLSRSEIALYVKVSGLDKAFMTKIVGGRIDFEAREIAAGYDYWELQAALAPEKVSRAFMSWTSLASRKKAYIVGLPFSISQKVRNAAGKNGKFLIESDGGVTFQPF